MTQQPQWGINLSRYFIIPQRVILAIMGFLAILNAYTMRVCLSQAITVLVIKKNATDEDSDVAICEPDELDDGTSSGGIYDWSEELQGLILSSFYIGYIVTHIPGGLLAEKFGGKWTLGLGILSTAAFTMLTPLAIEKGGSDWLIVSRVLMGLGEGTTFPALSVLLAAWVPANERGKLGALVLGGGQVGTIMGNLLSGVFLDDYDWPFVFYFFGGLGVIWFVIFVFLCYSDPSSHPFIKPSEREYLAKEIGTIGRNENLPPTPWKAILTNLPMFALVSAQIGHDWGFYIMVTDLPKYMADVLQFSIKANGLYSSLPYVMMWIVSVGSGFVADWMIRRGIMSTTNTRKVMTGLAAFGPAIFMVGASYAGCDRALVVVLFTICMGLMGAYYAGMKLSPLDMSPNYAGTLMAITNGIGAITGVITPYLVGVMTPNASLLEWRTVFWVAFGVLCVTAVVYCLWSSGEVQPFNNAPIQPRSVDFEAEERKTTDLKSLEYNGNNSTTVHQRGERSS
ncbi:putative inorganic phosphate cotransporter [Drosophila guanche]|uniref:Blast:Putative inorganic phosphate cotransporter n=1 Tax=Drosophila guanche TaxID=7266 RepID=A0A3B0K8S9_DROGU|nr:putative inorganic phosphate cotransporter [Drosophila guanche]SPP81431.1 blast:Putative inorganic phosphate cotransporter [Drosophila guanche]